MNTVIATLVRGLRRVLTAPGLWLGSWLALAFLAALTGLLVRLLVASAAVPYLSLDPGHLVYGVVDTLDAHRAAGAAMVVAILTSGSLAALGWMLLSPVIIARLAVAAGSEPSDPRPGVFASLRHLPAIAVQTLWHLVLRAVALVAMALTVQPLPGAVAWPLLVLTWVACGVALDVTRVTVVEHEAAPFSFRTAWRSLVHTLRRPRLWLGCGLLSVAQLGLSVISLYWALAHLADGSTWLPRLLTLTGVGLGLWRIGAIIEALDDDAP